MVVAQLYFYDRYDTSWASRGGQGALDPPFPWPASLALEFFEKKKTYFFEANDMFPKFCPPLEKSQRMLMILTSKKAKIVAHI